MKKKILLNKVDFFVTFVHVNVQNFRYMGKFRFFRRVWIFDLPRKSLNRYNFANNGFFFTKKNLCIKPCVHYSMVHVQNLWEDRITFCSIQGIGLYFVYMHNYLILLFFSYSFLAHVIRNFTARWHSNFWGCEVNF